MAGVSFVNGVEYPVKLIPDTTSTLMRFSRRNKWFWVQNNSRILKNELTKGPKPNRYS
jgi:hypothetical protein